MFNNVNILLIGASQMAVDYYKVLSALQANVVVVGRSDEGVAKFHQLTGHIANKGGLDVYLIQNNISKFDFVIVAVGLEELYSTTSLLLKHGVKNILVEKPAGLDFTQIETLANYAAKTNSNVYVAYNRRFYESVIQTKKLIEIDGGIKSFHFEFTEWAHVIEGIDKKSGIKENWFLANSSHVIDLAFYIGGEPVDMSSYVGGKLKWHPVSVFAGAGVTNTNALFTYHSNWEAPGRWSVEFLTSKHRFILKPMEELHIQKKGSVTIDKYTIEDNLDKEFKPGLYKQVVAFLNNDVSALLSLKDHYKRMPTLKKMLNRIN